MKSQRDFVPKPRVARHELPWVEGARASAILKGLRLASFDSRGAPKDDTTLSAEIFKEDRI
jgi:hypothetical protein